MILLHAVCGTLPIARINAVCTPINIVFPHMYLCRMFMYEITRCFLDPLAPCLLPDSRAEEEEASAPVGQEQVQVPL